MGIIKAFSDSVFGVFGDQYKEIIVAAPFDEHTIVVPGILKNKSNGRGANVNGSDGVISNGSRIYVPENTVAVIFNGQGIENIVYDSGYFEYHDGEESVFNGDGFNKAIKGRVKERVGFGGISPDDKKIAYINLREIRDIMFGTKGVQNYHDNYCDCDLEITAHGRFSIRITDAEKLIKNFVPAGTLYYSFADSNVKSQIIADFLQSLMTAIGKLSENYRISELPAKANEIAEVISSEKQNAGTWVERFGFEVIQVSLENIDFSDYSKKLVKKFSKTKMKFRVFKDVSAKEANLATQESLVEGATKTGLGSIFGTIFGHKLMQEEKEETGDLSYEKQIETLKKFKHLLDEGIITQEEYDAKKKEIMGL